MDPGDSKLAYRGIWYHPRYSEEIPGTNKLIYAAYGSGDYKNIKTNQSQCMRKGFWFWQSAEDMVYKSEDQRLRFGKIKIDVHTSLSRDIMPNCIQ